MTEKEIQRIIRQKEELAREYNVPTSSVIWAGSNRYVVIKDGKEIWI